MGKKIIKQPNGKYCLFSSVVDNVTHYDCTPEEIVEALVESYRGSVEIQVSNTIKKLETGEKPYHQFTMSYDEMIQKIKMQHGEDEAADIIKTIEKHGN